MASLKVCPRFRKGLLVLLQRSGNPAPSLRGTSLVADDNALIRHKTASYASRLEIAVVHSISVVRDTWQLSKVRGGRVKRARDDSLPVVVAWVLRWKHLEEFPPRYFSSAPYTLRPSESELHCMHRERERGLRYRLQVQSDRSHNVLPILVLFLFTKRSRYPSEMRSRCLEKRHKIPPARGSLFAKAKNPGPGALVPTSVLDVVLLVTSFDSPIEGDVSNNVS